MKKMFFLVLMFFSACAFAEPSIDINITYEGSVMKVRETVCEWTPSLENGYAADENGCYYTTYRLDQPLYGYKFTPKMGALPQAAKAAYYIAFYDSTIPDGKSLHTYVIKDGQAVRSIEGIYHDRVLQGVALLKPGETLMLTSDEEQHYVFIYIITAIIAAVGVFAIVRRKNR